MKRVLLLALLAACLILVSSCDKRDDDNGLPTSLEIILEPKEDFYLIVSYDNDSPFGDTYMYIDVMADKKLLSLRLNETLVPLDGFIYTDHTGYYHYYMDTFFLDGALIGDYDEELIYKMVFEDRTVTGTILMPSEYQMDTPIFDPQADLVVTWTLSHSPMIQHIGYVFSDYENSVQFSYELKGSVRTHTLEHEKWDDMGMDRLDYLCLFASNYKRYNGGLVIAEVSKELEYGKSNPNPTLKREQRLKRILSTDWK
ncbi:MAG TPA: hypothetical protein PLX77_05600 [Candidatus Cloacimonadota bacterium]|nr:hypothetical protein [Candidatus Cloacimonadota bacterium]